MFVLCLWERFQPLPPQDLCLFVCLFRFKVSIAIFFVHYNLMLTVLLSEIVFLVGIDRSEIPVSSY